MVNLVDHDHFMILVYTFPWFSHIMKKVVLHRAHGIFASLNEAESMVLVRPAITGPTLLMIISTKLWISI